jgi:hypothetical protein
MAGENGIMSRKLMVLTVIVGLGMVTIGVRAAGAQDEDEGPLSNMHFVVVRDWNAKPIRNAAVVLHPITKNGKQALGGMELKTDDGGKTGIDGIPYGPLRVQVLADGFQTFGEDYQVNRPEMEITVRLKRPVKQYSTTGVQESAKKPDDKKAGASKTGEPKPQ